jgi:uncharacterized protein (TIGR03435 family)
MLQTLLTDRFKLAVHRETRQGQEYSLVVGKNGSELEDAKDGQKNYINWTGPGAVTFTENQTLAGFNLLSSLLNAPVLDKTNSRGSYNFGLEFIDPRLPQLADDAPRPNPSKVVPIYSPLCKSNLDCNYRQPRNP